MKSISPQGVWHAIFTSSVKEIAQTIRRTKLEARSDQRYVAESMGVEKTTCCSLSLINLVQQTRLMSETRADAYKLEYGASLNHID